MDAASLRRCVEAAKRGRDTAPATPAAAAAAERTRSPARKVGRRGGPQGGASSGGGGGGDQQDLLVQLLRDHLHLRNDTRPALDSTAVVVLFRSDATAKEVQQLGEAWIAQAPPRAPRGSRPAEHPWGPKKLFMLAAVWEMMQKRADTWTGAADEQQKRKEALTRLLDCVPRDTDMAITTFRPKYATAMSGRTWKWDMTLSPLVPEHIRSSIATLIQHWRDAEVHIAPRRTQQTEAEQQLWQRLKDMTQRGRTTR